MLAVPAGGLSEEDAFRMAIATWPRGIRPVVHWSESQEGRQPNAHSDYVTRAIMLYGLEDKVRACRLPCCISAR